MNQWVDIFKAVFRHQRTKTYRYRGLAYDIYYTKESDFDEAGWWWAGRAFEIDPGIWREYALVPLPSKRAAIREARAWADCFLAECERVAIIEEIVYSLFGA